MQRWTKILLALVGLVVLALASSPFFVNANTFRPTIETQLTRALGRSVKLGDLGRSIFSASLIAKDFSVADDPNFSAAPFLTAKEVRIGVFLLVPSSRRSTHPHRRRSRRDRKHSGVRPTLCV
jgi:AsmA protein